MRTRLGNMAILLGAIGIPFGVVAAPENNPTLAPLALTTSKPDMTLGNCEDVQTPDNPNGQLGGGYPLLVHYKIIGITNLRKYFPFKMQK